MFGVAVRVRPVPDVYELEQVLPQLIERNSVATVPPPAFVTESM